MSDLSQPLYIWGKIKYVKTVEDVKTGRKVDFLNN